MTDVRECSACGRRSSLVTDQPVGLLCAHCAHDRYQAAVRRCDDRMGEHSSGLRSVAGSTAPDARGSASKSSRPAMGGHERRPLHHS